MTAEPTPEQVAEHEAYVADMARHHRPEPPETALPVTRDAMAALTPASWVHVSAFLASLLERAPLRDGQGNGWHAERQLLGALVIDLDFAARAAGEPTAYRMDLRSRAAKERDRQLLERLDHDRDDARRQMAAIDAAIATRPESSPAPDDEPVPAWLR